jgi:UDPglucose 6-dehydrogenase
VAVNDQRKRAMARKVVGAMGGDVRGKTVAILGLTFKPNTDDMREAPSLSIIQALQDAGAQIRAYDPEGMDAARPMLEDVTYTQSAYEAAEGAAAVVIVTEWDAFRALDLGRLKGLMAEPLLVDLRNVYQAEHAERAGFRYVSVGRPGKLEPVETRLAAE